MSIDRSDLWDLRHSKELEGEGFLFSLVVRTASKARLYTGTEAFDDPYNAYPGPFKNSGCGFGVSIEHFGEVEKSAFISTTSLYVKLYGNQEYPYAVLSMPKNGLVYI